MSDQVFEGARIQFEVGPRCEVTRGNACRYIDIPEEGQESHFWAVYRRPMEGDERLAEHIADFTTEELAVEYARAKANDDKLANGYVHLDMAMKNVALDLVQFASDWTKGNRMLPDQFPMFLPESDWFEQILTHLTRDQ